MLGRLRLAGPQDDGALARLFGDVPMAGELVLATRRDPSFFRLYQIQRGRHETWVYEVDGQLTGMGTALVRDGFYGGIPCPVGYLGDLRANPVAQRQRALPRFYGDSFGAIMERHGCAHFLTAILASNAAALNALVRRKAGRARQPRYDLFRRFDMVSVQFTRRRARPRDSEVRPAVASDLPELTALLARDHRTRPFGYRFDDGELQHRLAHWPGFSLARTYLAFARGRLAGCATAWDAAAVKRYQVLAYRGRMRAARRAFNLAAHVLGWPRLPPPGQAFRYFYLSNLSVADDDPAVLRALLERIYADFRDAGYHFFSLPLYEDDPLAPALRGFAQRRLPFHLYEVSPPNAPPPQHDRGRPGFEMALA